MYFVIEFDTRDLGITWTFLQVEQVEVIQERTVAAGRAPHLVLNAAHDLLDHYLPEGRRDPEEPGGWWW